jgi:hypothetical protein
MSDDAKSHCAGARCSPHLSLESSRTQPARPSVSSEAVLCTPQPDPRVHAQPCGSSRLRPPRSHRPSTLLIKNAPDDCPAAARVAPSCRVGGGGPRRARPSEPLSQRLERARRSPGERIVNSGAGVRAPLRLHHGSIPAPPVVLVLRSPHAIALPGAGSGSRVKVRRPFATANIRQSMRRPIATTAGIFLPPLRSSIAR